MKLFELNRLTYEIEISPEALLLEPFKKIVDRDKSKDKSLAKKELALIYHYCDIRSDYHGMEDTIKLSQIIDNLGLSKTYKPDKIVTEAITFYSSFKTPIEQLYEDAIVAGNTVGKICRESNTHADEAEDKLKAAQQIVAVMEKIPKAMSTLKTAEKEFIKEKKETEGRMKGSKELGMFEGTTVLKVD